MKEPEPEPEADQDQDQADMARLVGGDPSALDDLMARHAGRLQGLLFRVLQNAEDAEDIAQETFVRVFEHRGRFEAGRDFRSWLYTIAMNRVRDRFRWRSRHPESPLDPGPVGDSEGASGRDFTDPAGTPADSTQATERAEAVRSEVARLPEELRIPLVLAEFEEQSHAQIGGVLGCSPKAVEMKLYRARQLLRQRLARWLRS